MNNNLKITIAIILIIGILLIGILWVIPIGDNTTEIKNDSTSVEPETHSSKKVKKKTVTSNTVDSELDILDQRTISLYKYHLNSNLGQVAELYNSAIDQMLRYDIITCDASMNDNNFFIKLDLNNVIGYLSTNISNQSSGELYMIHNGSMYHEFSKDFGQENWDHSATTSTLSNSRNYMIQYFMITTFDFHFWSPALKYDDWQFELAEDEVVNDYLCYKIVATQNNIEKDIYISKDFNVIIKIDLKTTSQTSTEYFGYNDGDISIPEDISQMLHY